MEVDGTSNTSSDSNNGRFSHNLNYYNENLLFTTNGKLDAYFSSDKVDRKNSEHEKINRKNEFFKKDDFCANSHVNKGKLNDVNKRLSAFVEGYDKKIDSNVDSRKSLIEFNNNKKNMENSIHLHSVDSFGKKSIGFSPDQVSRRKK